MAPSRFHVARTTYGPYLVSTIELSQGYETMIFGPEGKRWQRQYKTRDESASAHNQIMADLGSGKWPWELDGFEEN